MGLFAALPEGSATADAAGAPPALQAGADRLSSLQNNDGGWDWQLDDGNPATGSALNTIAPIAKGLAEAYLHTGNFDHEQSLADAGALLLSKVTFATSDGYLAAQLDALFNVTTYSAYVQANFYDKLANGTYVRGSVTYSTPTYIDYLRASRSGQSANLAAWDLGLGLVSAASCGVTGTELQYWIDAVKAEINELDDYDASNQVMWYFTDGLAGALYGLAFVDESMDPTAGYFAGADDIGDLFAALATYQINNGGVTWHPDYMLANDQNENTQATAYSILALNEYDRAAYLNNIRGAADYLLGIQLATGGWDNYPAVGTYPASGENNEVTGEALWGISVAYPELWVCPSGDCGHPGAAYNTIQGAIDAIPVGGIIHVLPGTYNEAITLNKPNITVQSTDGADATIIHVPDGTRTNGVLFSGTNLGVLTFDGFTVENFSEGGIIQGMASRTGTTVHVLNNVLVPADGYLRNGIQVSGDGSTVIGNTVTSAYLTDDWSSTAIGVVDASNVTISGNTITGVGNYGISAYTWNAATMSNIQILDNTITGIDYPLGVIAYNDGTVSGVDLHNNRVSGYIGAIEAEAYHEPGYETYWGTLVEDVDATHNWWGSPLGPQGPVYGDPALIQWCADAACTTFAPDASGLIELSGPISQTGALQVYVPHLTILLSDGTVIQNNSPCIDVHASYTTITTESIGGAKCVPTDGSNGINVAADLVNIIIEGIEFDGTGQTTGSGVAFAGAITDVQVVDNWFHNLGGSGIAFGGAVNNNQGIQGNLFQALGADAIVSPTMAVNAEYNSWGAYGGASLANVDSDPWTHVDLYVQSSGTPWANQVFTGGTITYTVYGNLQNVMGADFTLTYDPALLTLQTATAGAYFTIPALDPELGPSPLDTSVPGVIRFAGFQTTPVTGNNLPIFTATFTAAAPGTAALDLLDAGDAFAMFPGYGPSTNIYPAALLDGTVTVIAAPTLSSTDLAGPYLTDVLQEFHVTLNNPATGGSFSNVLVNFLVTGADPADVNSFEYWEVTTSSWQPMPLTSDGLGNLVGSFGPALGFPIVPGYNATSLFRVNFDTPGTYPVTMTLVDLTTDPDAVLASLAQDAVVYAQPVLSSTNLVGPYLAGIPQEFTLTVTNPAGGGNYTDPVLEFNLPTGAVLEYFDGTTWQTVTSPLDLAALAPDTVTNLLFRATFPAGGSYLVDFTLVETATDPDWTLAALQQGVDVYANYSVTGTVSMQGRTYRGGVLVTLTGPALFAYGPYTATSLDVISSNVSFSNVAENTYTVTVTHARYLDVSSDLMKTRLVNAAPTVLTSLELKGGDANDDQNVNLGDASAIGSNYGATGDINADVNFSGRVDVFDLAMVGGNFTLNAAAAYGGWIP